LRINKNRIARAKTSPLQVDDENEERKENGQRVTTCCHHFWVTAFHMQLDLLHGEEDHRHQRSVSQ
jgi:hypothetical protein